MPFEIKKTDDPRVLDANYSCVVTVEDVQGVTDTCIAHIEETGVETLHVIMDMSAVEDPPKNLMQVIPAAREITGHPNMGWWIVWGLDDRFLQFMVQMVARVSRIRFRDVEDREAALAFLDKVLAASTTE